MLKKMQRYIRRNDGLENALSLFIQQTKMFGFKSMIKRISGNTGGIITDYQYWIEHNEQKYNKADVKKEINRMKHTPKISILLPVYNVDEVYLRACIDSIINQYYYNWELCVADDKSTAPHIKPLLDEYAAKDNRIKVVFREQNGHISEATNSALAVATGEYIALIDNDDMIKPEALFEVTRMINKHPKADMIYSDEDKVDATGTQRIWPAFKPDWSPDAFLCQMYIGHLGVYRRAIANEIGGFSSAFVGSQDYEFVLRFIEHTKEIYHVPKILYHWRMIPTSTAMGTENKDYAFDASFRAKQDVLQRKNIKADIVSFEEKHSTAFIYEVAGNNKVSIIIFVQKQNMNGLAKTIDSITTTSTWKNYQITIVASTDIISQIQETVNTNNELQYIELNYANMEVTLREINKQVTGNYLAFLEAGIEVATPNWMQLMVGQAKQTFTGVVGARIINNKDYIENAGLIFMPKSKKIYECLSWLP